MTGRRTVGVGKNRTTHLGFRGIRVELTPETFGECDLESFLVCHCKADRIDEMGDVGREFVK